MRLRRKTKRKPKTNRKQDFFTNLPSEIIIDILSRLPVGAILNCKYVCKQWLSVLKTDEFAKSHQSKSVPGLIVNGENSCIFFEFGDVLQLEHHEDRYIPVTEFDSSVCGMLQGSANGLLFFYTCVAPDFLSDKLNIVNPITGEYIRIRDPQRYADGHLQHFTCGFGVGRRTGQHTVVRIFHEYTCSDEVIGDIFPSSDCQVYTLGTRSWRSINPGPLLEYDDGLFGAFLNGRLYWLVLDSNGCLLISCFDLDDELFSTFPSPPALPAHRSSTLLRLSALEESVF